MATKPRTGSGSWQRMTEADRIREAADRFHGGGLGVIVDELAQNARRAGARRVRVDTFEDAGGNRCLRLADDGRGIADPAVVLTFGASEPGVPDQPAEKLAGTGLHCLAPRRAEIASRCCGKQWKMRVDRETFRRGTAAEVIEDAGPAAGGDGTEVTIRLEPGESAWGLEERLEYLPLCVMVNGTRLCGGKDFLLGCVRIEHTEGARIGVRKIGPHGAREVLPLDDGRPQVSIMGRVTTADAPELAVRTETDVWQARLDVVEPEGLETLLPNHDRIVPSERWTRLLKAARKAILRALAESGDEPVSRDCWLEASALGITMMEAPEALTVWHADPHRKGQRKRIPPNAAVVCPDLRLTPGERTGLAAAAEANGVSLFVGNVRMAGYRWYDRLRRIESARVELEGAEAPEGRNAAGKAERIRVRVRMREPDATAGGNVRVLTQELDATMLPAGQTDELLNGVGDAYVARGAADDEARTTRAAETLAAAVRVHEWEPGLIAEGRERVREHLTEILTRGARPANARLRNDLRAAVRKVLTEHGLSPRGAEGIEVRTTEPTPRIRVRAHEAA